MKIAIKKKKMFFETIAVLIVLAIFLVGWLYLEYIFKIILKPFDYNIYLEPTEGTAFQEDSINSAVIIFSNSSIDEPVEIYVSNCPKQVICRLSITNATPTYTSELLIEASKLTPEGTYPINIFAVSGSTKKVATYYLTIKPKGCICTPWINQGCGGICDLQMRLVRECEPKNCDIESRCAYNSSCVKDFSITSIPNYSLVSNQKASFTIKISSISNFSGLVYLSHSNCPPGAVCSFSLSPVNVPLNGSAISLLNIQTALGIAVGNFTIITTGFSNKTIHSTNLTITIL